MAIPGNERLPVPVVRARALVVDSQAGEARRLSLLLESDGFVVIRVADTESAAQRIEEGGIDVLVTEARSPRIDGLRLLHLARLHSPQVCVVFLISPGEEELATRAMDDGVHDFQSRPLNLDKLAAVVQRGRETQRLASRVLELQRRLDREFGWEGLIGDSAAVTSIWRKVRQVAAGTANVVLVGERGTGKGRLARALHTRSTRSDGPFVTVDCARASSEEFREELSGRSAAAFVAEGPAARPGAFQRAQRGTLVLEGIHELDALAQSHLLAILADGRVRPLGMSPDSPTAADQAIPVDVRLVTTSQRDLRELVSAGRFREELFYRLNVVTLFLPPLRQRPQDVPLLLSHFLEIAVEGTDLPTPGVTARALERLSRHPWTGNVRELKEVVSSMLVGWDGTRLLGVEDLPAAVQRSSAEEPGMWLPADASMRDLERRAIEAALTASRFDRRVAARRLGVSLRTFYRRLREYGIQAPRSGSLGAGRGRAGPDSRPLE